MEDLVWDEDAVINLSENLTIPFGSTLVIEEGVTVECDEGVQLRIEGGLQILGTEQKPVHFASYYESAKWNGIYIAPGAAASFEHTQIADARIGVFGVKANVEIYSSTINNCFIGACFYGMNGEPPLVSSSIFSNNAWGVVTLNGADIVLQNNIIMLGQKGVLIDASSPLFFGNEIKK
jgi:hypothetical protein